MSDEYEYDAGTPLLLLMLSFHNTVAVLDL